MNPRKEEQKCHDNHFKRAIDVCERKVGHSLWSPIEYGFCVGQHHAQMTAHSQENTRHICMNGAEEAFTKMRSANPDEHHGGHHGGHKAGNHGATNSERTAKPLAPH